jgi:hypothetical protein
MPSVEQISAEEWGHVADPVQAMLTRERVCSLMPPLLWMGTYALTQVRTIFCPITI